MKILRARLLLLVGAVLISAMTAAYAGGEDADSSADKNLIKRGQYVARQGDCMACHTSSAGGSGKPYAGGEPLETPFGTIYSTNITPDPEHGIGDWSEEEFAKAVRQGIRKDGKHLYPAMPYPSYTKISDRDIHALYAYMMNGVKPVADSPKKTDLMFPFSQRWGMVVWNWFFTEPGRFQPEQNESDEVKRGAYLVQGLGHCGSCHTPRGFAMQEKALDDSSDVYLSGSNLNDWWAPSIRSNGSGGQGIQNWDGKDIAEYLATGRNRFAAVNGPMTDVVKYSTSYFTKNDLHAVAAYLKSLPRHGDHQADQENGASAAGQQAVQQTRQAMVKGQNLSQGQRLYVDNCAACHKPSGMGSSRTVPRLVGNSLTDAENPTGLIHTILVGARMPSTPGAPEALAMPDFGWRLNDDEVAALATFLRSGWGNHAAKVTADKVADVRKNLSDYEKPSAPVEPNPRKRSRGAHQ